MVSLYSETGERIQLRWCASGVRRDEQTLTCQVLGTLDVSLQRIDVALLGPPRARGWEGWMIAEVTPALVSRAEREGPKRQGSFLRVELFEEPKQSRALLGIGSPGPSSRPRYQGWTVKGGRGEGASSPTPIVAWHKRSIVIISREPSLLLALCFPARLQKKRGAWGEGIIGVLAWCGQAAVPHLPVLVWKQQRVVEIGLLRSIWSSGEPGI